jgi:hypothetical protein
LKGKKVKRIDPPNESSCLPVIGKLKKFLLALCAGVLVGLAACGGGGGGGGGGGDGSSGNGGGDDSSGSPGNFAVFTPGEKTTLAAATVNELGGTIEVTGTGTALDGATVAFPLGALSKPTRITVGYDNGTVSMPEGDGSPSLLGTLTLDTDGATKFNGMVEITLPYTGSNFPVPFYADETGRLHAVLVTGIDRENKTLTFGTSHASNYPYTTLITTLPRDVDTKFRPSTDGFKIKNKGSAQYGGGECLGMSMFAAWFYNEKNPALGGFYGRYEKEVGKDTDEKTVTGENIIATRAFSSVEQEPGSKYFNDIYVPSLEEWSEQERYAIIITGLWTTREPIDIGLQGRIPNDNLIGLRTIKHSVLAYAAKTNGDILVYNSSIPGDDSEKIKYDIEKAEFKSYYWTIYDLVWGGGAFGSYDYREDFEDIFKDAEKGFTGYEAKIIFTKAQKVADRTVVLAGRIESNAMRVTDFWLGNTSLPSWRLDGIFAANLSDNGEFSVTVNLGADKNEFTAVTKGWDSYGNWVSVPNNLDKNPLSFSPGDNNYDDLIASGEDDTLTPANPQYTTVAFPGAVLPPDVGGHPQATGVDGMTASGEVWGYYYKADGSRHGFVTNGGSYVAVEPPGAYDSRLVAVESGRFYGNYRASGGHTRGFVYDGGSYTDIEYAGAPLTEINGVDASGLVFGNYWVSNGYRHGFVKTGSSYQSLDYPGAFTTSAEGITASGLIVGSYNDTHGFVLINGGYSNISFLGGAQFEIKGVADNGLLWLSPRDTSLEVILMADYSGSDWYGLVPDCSGSCTEIRGITFNKKTGRIAGEYKDGRKPYLHGFVMEGTTYTSSSHGYTSIDYPDPNENSVSGTYADGTSDAGAVFGGFFDMAGKEHGYVKIGDQWSEPIDYPGATATWVEGYNDATGQVWGSYVGTDGNQYNYVLNGGLSFR